MGITSPMGSPKPLSVWYQDKNDLSLLAMGDRLDSFFHMILSNLGLSSKEIEHISNEVLMGTNTNKLESSLWVVEECLNVLLILLTSFRKFFI